MMIFSCAECHRLIYHLGHLRWGKPPRMALLIGSIFGGGLHPSATTLPTVTTPSTILNLDIVSTPVRKPSCDVVGRRGLPHQGERLL